LFRGFVLWIVPLGLSILLMSVHPPMNWWARMCDHGYAIVGLTPFNPPLCSLRSQRGEEYEIYLLAVNCPAGAEFD